MKKGPQKSAIYPVNRTCSGYVCGGGKAEAGLVLIFLTLFAFVTFGK
jgi:hypothetical protein